ncbi:hypothetical protein EGR_09029 [Echinococcus granulosus]|uniref:Uncharacterized protein n=1 Tax=Echinococcus granulosus TaxID=6210 RepID=W6UCW8_ECHGR|nr:hypothetical protein EGR_09029 [Echinococcus granulosus]EUB56137.1 hypothetical protein EGR_09029 [Echinococcus granulosus]
MTNTTNRMNPFLLPDKLTPFCIEEASILKEEEEEEEANSGTP